jgi:membrane protease YdiL (CAAX protease family)
MMMLFSEIQMKMVHDHLEGFMLAVLLFTFAAFIAWLRGFFRFYPPVPPPVAGRDVLKGFVTFIITQVLILPTIIMAFFIWKTGKLPSQGSLSHEGWINIASICGGFLAVFCVFKSLTPHLRHRIIGDSTAWFHHMLVGIGAWFISYPLVLAMDQALSLVVSLWLRQTPVEQVAVRHFRYALGDPLIFWSTALAVVTLVPMVEEFLFRGLLQSWLRNKISRPFVAIALTSIIFALFHYSSSQGTSNIELLCSLFVLSCFLGYVYERQRSLWASIALHGFFNGMSVLMILQTK